MIIYNVTTKVDHSVASAWLQWMKDTHIPAVVATGHFTHAVILEMIEVDTTDGLTYAVQFHAPDQQHYNDYISNDAEYLRADALATWGNKIISFRSVLKVVD